MKILKAVLLTLLYFVIENIIQLSSYLAFGSDNYFENDHARGATILIARVAAYLVIFYFFWKPIAEIFSFKLQRLKTSVVLILFLIFIGTEFVNRPFADYDRLLEHTPAEFIYKGYSLINIYNALTALLIAPLFEELFFRKFLFHKLLGENGFVSALLVSSALFSIIHWETPLNLIPAFIFGLISAYIFYKTQNIIYSIILHFLYNALSQLTYYKAELYSDWLNWLNFGILYWSLFIFGIVITLLALRQISSKTDNEHSI